MYSVVYNFFLWAGFLSGLPLSLLRPKIRHYFKNRLGATLNKKCPKLERKCPIWIQALSVGEVLSTLPLIRLLKSHNLPIFFTASTITGYTIACQKLKNMVEYISYFPLDLIPVINRYLYCIKPHLVILIETEW